MTKSEPESVELKSTSEPSINQPQNRVLKNSSLLSFIIKKNQLHNIPKSLENTCSEPSAETECDDNNLPLSPVLIHSFSSEELPSSSFSSSFFRECGVTPEPEARLEASSPAKSLAPLQISKKNSKSRQQRNIRILSNVVLNKGQTKLTDFYTIVKDVEKLLEQDSEFKKCFCVQSQQYFKGINLHTDDVKFDEDQGLLNILKKSAMKNSQVRSHGNRFDEPLKLFSLYIFIIGGRLLYETLYHNMNNALPSITTINRNLNVQKLAKVYSDFLN